MILQHWTRCCFDLHRNKLMNLLLWHLAYLPSVFLFVSVFLKTLAFSSIINFFLSAYVQECILKYVHGLILVKGSKDQRQLCVMNLMCTVHLVYFLNYKYYFFNDPHCSFSKTTDFFHDWCILNELLIYVNCQV